MCNFKNGCYLCRWTKEQKIKWKRQWQSMIMECFWRKIMRLKSFVTHLLWWVYYRFVWNLSLWDGSMQPINSFYLLSFHQMLDLNTILFAWFNIFLLMVREIWFLALFLNTVLCCLIWILICRFTEKAQQCYGRINY